MMSGRTRRQNSTGRHSDRRNERARRPTLPPTPPSSFRQSFSSIDSSQEQSSMLEEEVPTSISWPIALAVIPTLGAFFAGSAEIWSDFVISLLILYYVYKWMTVPWSQYEEARSRRIIHQNATASRRSSTKQSSVADELRRHERVGLFWVIASPCIVAYTLRFSRYLLTNHERYTTYFNVGIFVLAALIKPFEHVVSHLRESAEQLQAQAKELGLEKREIDVLQEKTDALAAEIDELHEAMATKQDLGQITGELDPMLQKLAKASQRAETKEKSFQKWSEERFQALDTKFNELDDIITRSIEEDQRRSMQRTFVTLMFVPVNILFWIANLVTSILPAALSLQQSAILSSALPSSSTT